MRGISRKKEQNNYIKCFVLAWGGGGGEREKFLPPVYDPEGLDPVIYDSFHA